MEPAPRAVLRLEDVPGTMDAIAALHAADPAGAFLLESRLHARDTPLGGRWSFLGAWPSEVVEDLPALAGGAAGEIPFTGGAVGFLSYDYGRRLERLPARAEADQRFPDARFGLYRHVLAIDHEAGRAWVAGEEEGLAAAAARYREVLAARPGAQMHDFRASEASSDLKEAQMHGFRASTDLARTFTRDAYEAAVARAIEYIRAGDIFEVNLSQRFETRFAGGPLALYARLRASAPAPMAALLPAGEGRWVVSASPERYLAARGRRLTAEPIKGTRRRGASAAEDAALAEELLTSRKDRAELAMIVDLLRNDLGRVAKAGSVRVARAAELRSFPTVHHLVGVVEAELAPGATSLDAIRASFPGGSITGAPKVRAMEIIEELEPTRRSVYTGAFGWIAPSGDADLAIAIRTVLLDGERATFQAGGAVTAESDPASEYEETIAKARAVARALGVEL